MLRYFVRSISLATLAFLAISVTACSNQYRNADPGISEDELMELLSEVQGSSGSGVFSDLANNDQYSTIYFADGPGPMGRPEAIASLVDFSFIPGLPADVSPYDFEKVVVFFLVGDPLAENRMASLLIQVTWGGQIYSRTLDSSDVLDFSDGEFVAVMDDTLVLRSFDISDIYDDELAPTIQLRVGMFDEFGVEQDIGKFSVLTGFGGSE